MCAGLVPFPGEPGTVGLVVGTTVAVAVVAAVGSWTVVSTIDMTRVEAMFLFHVTFAAAASDARVGVELMVLMVWTSVGGGRTVLGSTVDVETALAVRCFLLLTLDARRSLSCCFSSAVKA